MMRLWCDVYDGSGARLGDGPIPLRSCAVTKNLDGVGSISITVPMSDARALDLLQHERRVRIYSFADEQVRELGRGILRKRLFSGSGSSFSVTWDGPDDLDALTKKSTLLGRKYSNSSVNTIASSLTGLVGWSASGSGGNNTDARFDGVSVWKALLALAEGQGLHVRGGSSANSVEIGAFGTTSGIRLINPVQMSAALYANDDVAVIEAINIEQSSEAVATRIYPMGSGIGEALLTLEKCTRTSPYTVQSLTGPDGSTQYYLEDAAGVAAFGVIEKFGKFREIAPLSNSGGDMQNAANALYDISAAWLTRYSKRQDVYSVTCRKVRKSIRPGDKVRLAYKGVIERDGVIVDYLDVDADLWVIDVTERAGVEGEALDLTLATIDQQQQNAADVVIGAMEEITLDGVTVKPYFNRTNWVYSRLMRGATEVHGNIPVRLTNATQRLVRCVLKVRSQQFISTVAPQVMIQPHRHSVFNSTAQDNTTFYWRAFNIYDNVSDATVKALLPVSSEAGLVLQSGVENVEDLAGLNWGVYLDDNTLSGIGVWVNGVDCTVALGGPFMPSGGLGTFEIDITPHITGVLQQEHTVQFRAAGGQGELEVMVEVYEVIQSIRV